MAPSRGHRRSRLGAAVVLTTVLGLAAIACSSGSGGSADTQTGGTTPPGGATAEVVRLGFFPNVTHAPALVGSHEGLFQQALGTTKLETKTFNAGPEAIEALNADALDITYVGPNPAINSFQKSGGEAIRIVGGSTSGGAYFVVAPSITSPQDLKGKTVASPQLGQTQDVALRVWLKDAGLSTDSAGGGDVSIAPQANGDTLNAFKAGDIAGAWVPEPWATRLIQEANGKVLVDERTLWPQGQYVTTHIIVRTDFLDRYPGTVKAVLKGHLAAIERIAADPAGSQRAANTVIEEVTQKALPQQVITASWANLAFTADPIAQSLVKSAEDAVAVGLLQPVELAGIYQLDLLNQLLAATGQPEVKGL